MPWRRLLFVSLFFFAIVARADIEFSGVLSSPDQTLFSLTDTSTATTSGWIPLGQSFAGYALKSYDAQQDLLTLTRDGAEVKIRLNDSKVQAAAVKIRGELRFRFGENVLNVRATLVFENDNSFPLPNGVFHITPRPLSDGKLQYDMFFDRRGPEGKTERFTSPSTVVDSSQGFGTHIATGKRLEDIIELSFKPRGS
jgi:hypothetical protein